MSYELEWDAEYSENTIDVQDIRSDISLTQTSATPNVDADLPKKVDGKICYVTHLSIKNEEVMGFICRSIH